MPHIQTQSEWEVEMSLKILDVTRSELYADLRFFDIALSSLVPKAEPALLAMATDGVHIKYAPAWLLRVFEKNPKFLGRAYLHSVLHCIYMHLWMQGGRKRQVWDIACDIIVEYTVDTMDKPSTRRALSWLRRQVYGQLAECKDGVSAAVVYRILLQYSGQQLAELQKEFYTDDHCYWPSGQERDMPVQQRVRGHWDKAARQARMKQEQSGSSDSDKERFFAAQVQAGKSRRSYREFLKKFAVLHEELHADLDEFDLNFYTYGLRLYQNMPFIEPLETREVKKIREFVIVVDTSDSTGGPLVKKFLRETFQILFQREQFFAKCKIRLLQCDDDVRMDQELTDMEQLERLLGEFTLVGGGGTDFRPAFRYVDALIGQGVFGQLGGLLYFTDGKGIYPKKRPPYPTAFVFLEAFDEAAVPPWAMRFRLDPEEI